MTRPLLARLGPLVVVALVVAAVVAGVRMVPHEASYTAPLPHAAGLRSGDPVRVAGLDTGKVTSVAAEGDTVLVEFTLDEDVELTEDTTTRVKLSSLLGQRYLELRPGSGAPVDDGGSLSREHALDTYTMERFWLDAPDQVRRLDPEVLDRAIDVLAQDLTGSPREVREALEGLSGVAGMVNRHDDQLGDLLRSATAVTDLVIDQQDELDQLMADTGLVLRMVVQRREAIRELLRDTHALVTELAGLAGRHQQDLTAALRDAASVLRTLSAYEKQLDQTLRLFGPTMRHFTSATGDGPWQGVYAPFAIVPDDLLCTFQPEECR